MPAFPFLDRFRRDPLHRKLPIQIPLVDEQTVFTAAHIKANHAISYADAFIVATAVQENATVVS